MGASKTPLDLTGKPFEEQKAEMLELLGQFLTIAQRVSPSASKSDALMMLRQSLDVLVSTGHLAEEERMHLIRIIQKAIQQER